MITFRLHDLALVCVYVHGVAHLEVGGDAVLDELGSGRTEPALEPVCLHLNVRVVGLLVILDLDAVGVVDVGRHRGPRHRCALTETALQK